MEFQESRTYANLQNAYNNDLLSSSRYRIYRDKARQEGYIEISNKFDITAQNVLEHARIWLRQLNNGELPSTLENIENSIELSTYYGNDLYRKYSQIAVEEGYNRIAALFNGIANIELNYLLNFQTIYDNMVNDTVFCKNTEVLWICMACGNILSGTCAPVICPVCQHPQGFYKVFVTYTVGR